MQRAVGVGSDRCGRGCAAVFFPWCVGEHSSRAVDGGSEWRCGAGIPRESGYWVERDLPPVRLLFESLSRGRSRTGVSCSGTSPALPRGAALRGTDEASVPAVSDLLFEGEVERLCFS